VYDEEHRARCLDLVKRFIPGVIGAELADAVFWSGNADADDVDLSRDEADELKRLLWQKKRKRWPWLQWMLKWGYPPGWVAGRGQLEFSFI
jgi:hypothetical protein